MTIGSCVSECNSSYAVDLENGSGSTYYICEKCDSSCLTCFTPSNSTRCLSCNYNSSLYRYF